MPSPSSSGGCLSLLTHRHQTGIKTLVTTAVTLAAIPQLVAGQLAFAGSCNIQTAQLNQSYLGMYCNNLNTASFGYNWTWIDLDACIANSNGNLVGKKNGNFQKSCSGCETSLSRLPANPHAAGRTGSDAYKKGLTLSLKCTCLSSHRRRPTTSTLDLNIILVDVDGAMGCYGRLGNKTLGGPLPEH
ncbi:uncharacterized protein SPSK_09763 [Sporothrix schenckii 1099-18]|uniref:Cyanovirin-N domain-containing protein n=1 Tax=Sporothrix schenckii 1099-18 TaxID=1397361 RepID=A0A0F2M7Q2_SPOSC|nr:uncharacterized protein SPSK_09763 [Sporothrix schenckii 1099-18]KJR84855.1 hypothetical protein SPSK_09763 [Sporothrix schenckii 1099-18]